MTIIEGVRNEDGSVHLPQNIEIPVHHSSFCDGVNYYLFETEEEKIQFYQDNNIS